MLVDVILILAAVMALAPYVVGPIAVRMAQRWPARPEFEPYDPIRQPLPDDLASAFRQSVDALVRDGSQVLADLAHESAVSSVQLRVGLLSDAGATTCALVVGGRSTKPKAKLAGCYAGELADPAALAQRFYAFCPDIVVQGTGSVSALARELGRERTLYCWWD